MLFRNAETMKFLVIHSKFLQHITRYICTHPPTSTPKHKYHVELFFFHTPQSIKDQQTYQKQEDFCWMLISKTWPLCLFTDVSFFSGESLTSVNISRAAGMPRSSKGNTRFLLVFFFLSTDLYPIKNNNNPGSTPHTLQQNEYRKHSAREQHYHCFRQ